MVQTLARQTRTALAEGSYDEVLDLLPDANGFIICTEKSPYQYQSTRLIGFRKFSTIEARDAFIESEGGIEVFRQKLAKGWPV